MSLTEVIVAISILLIIASFTISTISGALEHSRRTQCVSNLRTLHMAIVLYAQDKDGYLPMRRHALNEGLSDNWHRNIYPYVMQSGVPGQWHLDRSGIYICPSDQNVFHDVLSYSMNSRLEEKKIHEVHPSIILLADSAPSFKLNPAPDSPYYNTEKPPTHSGGDNILFMDGSVSLMEKVPNVVEEPALWLPAYHQ